MRSTYELKHFNTMWRGNAFELNVGVLIAFLVSRYCNIPPINSMWRENAFPLNAAVDIVRYHNCF